MTDSNEPKPEKFGTLLGIAAGGVPAYSSDYRTADPKELPNRSSYRSHLDGLYLGYKWQCVEFARRWLYLNKGYIFDDVAMAYEIFRLRCVRRVSDRHELPLHAFANGSRRHPEPGCLIIWAEGGEFENTGHVAVATEVTNDYVRVAEQNVGHQKWGEGRDWAREIGAEITEDGEFWLECSFGDAEILGWVIQTDDATDAEELDVPEPALLNLVEREAPSRAVARSWLNIANEDEKAYVAMMGGHKLSSNEADQRRYYVISESAHEELQLATNQLHSMFMHATDHVLQDDRLLQYFNLPEVLWHKIHQSWDNRLNQTITGRFDFSLSDRGIKVYEYNCDSASCHMECGKVQGKWADYYECEDGDDPGAELHNELRDAWKRSDVDGVLHIMQDDDPEETYHALFMKDALDEADIQCKIIHGLRGLSWADDGSILDADGEPIRWVWKTWAWETALDQLRDELEAGAISANARRQSPPRLVDVLLRDEVMVYEPLWTLIPSNKAILPILWEMFPDHPWLLDGAFELSDSLRRSGYAAKPIVGRCGSNISMFDASQNLIEASAGKFTKQAQIFQQWFPLPQVGKYNVQVSTFTAGGSWAGTCLRVDESRIINNRSDNLALRVVPDREL